MLAWLLDAIASGLSRLYGRPLGHDVAIVFLVAFVFTIIVAARWSRFGSSGVTAAVSAPLMSPSGAMRLLATASAVLRGASPAKGVGARDPGARRRVADQPVPARRRREPRRAGRDRPRRHLRAARLPVDLDVPRPAADLVGHRLVRVGLLAEPRRQRPSPRCAVDRSRRAPTPAACSAGRSAASPPSRPGAWPDGPSTFASRSTAPCPCGSTRAARWRRARRPARP